MCQSAKKSWTQTCPVWEIHEVAQKRTRSTYAGAGTDAGAGALGLGNKKPIKILQGSLREASRPCDWGLVNSII